MTPSYNNKTLQDSINSSSGDYEQVRHVVTCFIISAELLLILVAIYAVYALVRWLTLCLSAQEFKQMQIDINRIHVWLRAGPDYCFLSLTRA